MLKIFKFFNKTRRASERIPVKVKFKYHYNKGDYMGLLKDVCANGFSFLSSTPVEHGKDIDVEVVMQSKTCEGKLNWVSLKEKAKVRWMSPRDSVNHVDYEIGCEFTEPGKEPFKRFYNILKKVIKRGK